MEANWQDFFADIAGRPITIVYEQLSADFAGAMEGLASSLGVSPRRTAPPRLERQANQATEALVDQMM